MPSGGKKESIAKRHILLYNAVLEPFRFSVLAVNVFSPNQYVETGQAFRRPSQRPNFVMVDDPIYPIMINLSIINSDQGREAGPTSTIPLFKHKGLHCGGDIAAEHALGTQN